MVFCSLGVLNHLLLDCSEAHAGEEDNEDGDYA